MEKRKASLENGDEVLKLDKELDEQRKNLEYVLVKMKYVGAFLTNFKFSHTLNLTQNYPKTEPYISLFVGENDEMIQKREEMKKKVEEMIKLKKEVEKGIDGVKLKRFLVLFLNQFKVKKNYVQKFFLSISSAFFQFLKFPSFLCSYPTFSH